MGSHVLIIDVFINYATLLRNIHLIWTYEAGQSGCMIKLLSYERHACK